MALERQTSFGWIVATDIFLGGTGAGLFLTGFSLSLLNLYNPLAKLATVIGPLLVLFGSFFLLIDLGSITKLWRLFSNPSSWLSRGTGIIAIFIICGLGYSLPSYDTFSWLPWNTATILQIIGIIAAIFSILVMIYTGILFAVVKAIPFWNTSALPILFFLSSLITGTGCLLLLAPFMIKTYGQEISVAIHNIDTVIIVLTCSHSIVLWNYLDISGHRSLAALESVRALKTPLFIIGGIIIGLVLPLLLLGVSVVTSNISVLSNLGILAAVFLLAGGILQKYSIIKAGIYSSLH